jgi:LmbE family N-acetylglucosaminyl deacetylase
MRKLHERNHKSSVLVIAAHPDDEVLGCGGTIAKMVSQNQEVYTLILGTGVAGRYKKADPHIQSEIESLKDQAYSANGILGVQKLMLYDFPDNRFDGVDLLDIVKIIEDVVRKVQPALVFTHYYRDLNIDHRIVYDATITAVRRVPGQVVKEVYSYEVLSSTEYMYPQSFSPNVYFDIEDYIDIKKKALSCYQSEMKEFPHPRSLEAVELCARLWGSKVGLNFIEAMECVWCIR